MNLQIQKGTMSDVENTVDGINGRLGSAEENIFKHEDI